MTTPITAKVASEPYIPRAGDVLERGRVRYLLLAQQEHTSGLAWSAVVIRRRWWSSAWRDTADSEVPSTVFPNYAVGVDGWRIVHREPTTHTQERGE